MTITLPSNSFLFDIHIHQECLDWKGVDFDIETVTRKIFIDVLTQLHPLMQTGEITIVLANSHYVKDLNKKYRNQDKPTNILSFGYGADVFKNGMLGDLFLSFETIDLEAKEQKKSFCDHYSHLIVHGILHLLGYDHEHEHDAEKMEMLEIKFLADLNISNPYISYERG